MTALETDDLAAITGPLALAGLTPEGSYVDLVSGEVVRVVRADTDGNLWVYGFESDLHQWIDAESLTPMEEIYDDPDVQWGYLIDPEYIHDFVYEGDE